MGGHGTDLGSEFAGIFDFFAQLWKIGIGTIVVWRGLVFPSVIIRVWHQQWGNDGIPHNDGTRSQLVLSVIDFLQCGSTLSVRGFTRLASTSSLFG